MVGHKKLMQYGLDSFQYKDIEPAIYFETIPVENGIPQDEDFTEKAQLRFCVKGKKKISERILMSDEESVRVETKIKKEWKAPIEKGERAGTVTYYLNDIPVREYEVVTENGVEEMTWNWCLRQMIEKYMTL